MMKNKYIAFVTFFLLSSMQIGCHEKSIDSIPYPISITVSNQNIDLLEVDTENNAIVSDAAYSALNLDERSTIFAPLFLPLLEDKNESYVTLDDAIEFTFSDAFDNVIIYDHLLKEDGTDYYRYPIEGSPLAIDNNKSRRGLSHNILRTIFQAIANFLKMVQ